MPDVLITFDTTGSMSPCIAEVRRRVTEALDKLFDNIPELRIGIISHGDWCDGNKAITSIGFTNDRKLLQGFIKTAPNTGGGDSDEFYEYVLHLATQFDWQSEIRLMMVIGDALPHKVGYTYGGTCYNWDWKFETQSLADLGVQIYGIQALPTRYSSSFYEEISARTGGRKLNLNQFSDAVEIITAVCYHGQGRLQEYRDELQSAFKMNRNLAAVFGDLDTIVVMSVDDKSGLVPVPPYRFQMVHVDENTSIKPFVESIGASFKIGRGFYQFTKAEEIQERKEVILRNRLTGDMFTGAEAREYIGLPYGSRGTIRPGRFAEYEVYVQSTSPNRKLMAGTTFLYENEAI